MTEQTDVAALVERLRAWPKTNNPVIEEMTAAELIPKAAAALTALSAPDPLPLEMPDPLALISDAYAALTAAQERVRELEAERDTLAEIVQQAYREHKTAEAQAKEYREALEVIAGGDGDRAEIARQTLSDTQPEGKNND